MDNEIILQLDKIETAITALNLPRPKYITNGVFLIAGKKFNLHTINSLDELVRLLAIMIDTENAESEARRVLNITPLFSINDDIKADFKVRADLIRYTQKINKLLSIKEQLEETISDKGKRKVKFQSLLDDIDDLIGE